jgi:hypothetical protein
MADAAQEPPEGIIGFQTERARIQEALDAFAAGRKTAIALISEPFAGRTTLLTAIEAMISQQITKLALAAPVTDKDALALPEEPAQIVLIDNCHFLYLRTIGGFRVIKEFLDSIASAPHLFITTWNLFSWNYLDQVINIGRYFPIQLSLPKFSTPEIKGLILSGYREGEIEFLEDGTTENKRIVTIGHYPLTFKPLKKPLSLSVPIPHIDFNWLKFRLSRKREEKKAEDIIFETITRIANGNLGVAKLLWAKSLQYPTIKPSYVQECSFKIELDYTESFTLYTILAMESINEEELAAVTGERKLDTILYRLAQQGLITREKGYYHPNPAALSCIEGHLKRVGVIW